MPLYPPSGGGGSGTVTSVASGTGLSGGPITTSGTLTIDSTVTTLTGSQTLTNKTLTAPAITTPTVTGSGTWTASAALSLNTTKVNYVTLENTTAAVAGTQQNSPMMEWSGRGWNGTASEVSRWVVGNYPLADQGAGASEARLGFWGLNGSATPGTVPLFRIHDDQASSRVNLVAGTGKVLALWSRDQSADFFSIGNGGLAFGVSATTMARMNGTSFYPNSAGGLQCGETTTPWSATVSRLYASIVGTALTVSSNTIAPIRDIHHVGAGLIKTITVPTLPDGSPFIGSVTLWPDAAFTYDATGNILVAAGGGTAVVDKPMVATYDGTKWAMSY